MLLSELVQSKFNRRKEYHQVMIDDLAESIRKHGLLSRIILRKTPEGNFEVLAGWRRRLALAVTHGEKELPPDMYVILDVDDLEAVKISITENVHRVNLSALDMAEFAQALIEQRPSMKAKEIARELWTTEARVKRLLDLGNHLDKLPDTAIQCLGTPDENDPAFTDAHVEAMDKSGAFTLEDSSIRDVVDLIITQELPASKVAGIVDRMVAKSNGGEVSTALESSGSSSDDITPEVGAQDGTMKDSFKGILKYVDGELVVETKREAKPVDFGYYHQYVLSLIHI